MSKSPASSYKQHIAAVIASGASLTSGLSFAWSSPIQAQIVRNDVGQCAHSFCVSKMEFAWIATSMAIGSLALGLVAGPLMTKIGRKGTMFAYFVPLLCGWFLLTFAYDAWMLYVGRFLVGVATGGAFVLVPLYIGEIAETSIRGKLISHFQISLCNGNLTTYLTGFLFPMVVQNSIATALVIVYGIGLLFIPESPRFYVASNQIKKAKTSLQWLRGRNFDTEKEVEQMVEFHNSQQTGGFKTLFKNKGNLKALVIVIGLMTGFRMSGISAVLFYTSSIFKDADTGIDPNLAAIFIGLMNVVATFSSSFVVDKAGRKVILLLSNASIFICFVLMGGYFELQRRDPEIIKDWGMLPVVLICLYMVMNMIGVGSVSFVIMGEIFAPNIKDMAAGISIAWNNVLMIVVSLLFPFLTDAVGSSGTFFIFSGFIASSFMFVLLVVPETKGKTFEEIQNLLAGIESSKL